MSEYTSPTLKNEVLNRDKFTCQKCGFKGSSQWLEVHHIQMRVNGGENHTENLITLCSICHHYAPDDENDFNIYANEKIDGSLLDTFRKSKKSISIRTKKGMISKSASGEVVSKAPRGYKMVDKKLVPKEDSHTVQIIFQDFLDNNTSLTQLGKKYGLSVNGLKKVLTNQTYLGKVKFDGQTHQGSHQPLVSATLFNHVQNKIEKLGLK